MDGITGEAVDELLESRDEYTAEGVSWIPPQARWQYLMQRAKQPEIGKLIDNEMDLIVLSRFASGESKGGGEFYTRCCVVKLLVEMIELLAGRVHDGYCGLSCKSSVSCLFEAGKARPAMSPGRPRDPPLMNRQKCLQA